MPWPGYEWGLLNPVEKPSQLGQKNRGEFDFYETDPLKLALQAGEKLLEPDAFKDVDIWRAIVLREVDAKEHSATKEIQRRFKIKLMEGDACIPFNATRDYSKTPKSVNQQTDDQHFTDFHITATAGANIPFLKPGDRCLVKFQHNENFSRATIVGVPDAKQSEIQSKIATGAIFRDSELSKISHMRKYLVSPNQIKGQLAYVGASEDVAIAVLDYESYYFEACKTCPVSIASTVSHNNFSTWNASQIDKSGVAFGFIQFNQRAGSLYLLFQQMHADAPSLYNKHFGKFANKLRDRRWLKGVAFRKRTLNNPNLKRLIIQTADIAVFRGSQYKVAKKYYFDIAVSLANQYNLKSANAYAVCTGIGIFHGFSARVGGGLRYWLAEAKKTIGGGDNYEEAQFLKVLANLIDRKRWQIGEKGRGAARANHSLKYFRAFLEKPPGDLHRYYLHKGGVVNKNSKIGQYFGSTPQSFAKR